MLVNARLEYFKERAGEQAQAVRYDKQEPKLLLYFETENPLILFLKGVIRNKEPNN